MHLHPDIQHQLAHDRRRELIRQAEQSRIRRDARSIRRQLRKSG
jgi:hypothetical protein